MMSSKGHLFAQDKLHVKHFINSYKIVIFLFLRLNNTFSHSKRLYNYEINFGK